MSPLRSLATTLLAHPSARPVADDDGDDDDDDCWSQPAASDPLPAAILAPPTPRPSPSQIPHATLPAPHRDQTSVILASAFGVLTALVALVLAARYVRRRRSPFDDPCKQMLRFRSKKRLSDESWVSPVLPDLASPVSPLSQDLELRQYACAQRLVSVTTPVCTPTDTEFRVTDPMIAVPPVRVPSPAYISPFSPSPSVSSSPVSLSPTPSTEPLTSSARLSRLLSSTFRGSCEIESPARPSTAYFRSDYSLTSPTRFLRLAGTRSRAEFYPDDPRDTLSTATTTDTVCAAPRPSEDPDRVTPSASASTLQPAPVLKLRLSDASEHARYRLREKERERERQLDRDRFSVMDDGGRREFRLRDSESVLREIGW